MGNAHLELGRAGEDAALRQYVGSGYELLGRNWRCRLGELDLILALNELIVFCEVKTRRGSALGGGYEAVTATKRAKLRRLAELFLIEQGATGRPARFDVASVCLRDDRPPVVALFEDAF